MKIFAILLLILTSNLFAENCGSFWTIGFPDPSRIHLDRTPLQFL